MSLVASSGSLGFWLDVGVVAWMVCLMVWCFDAFGVAIGWLPASCFLGGLDDIVLRCCVGFGCLWFTACGWFWVFWCFAAVSWFGFILRIA